MKIEEKSILQCCTPFPGAMGAYDYLGKIGYQEVKINMAVIQPTKIKQELLQTNTKFFGSWKENEVSGFVVFSQ